MYISGQSVQKILFIGSCSSDVPIEDGLLNNNKSWNYELVKACGYSDGVSLLNRSPFDAVILDLGLRDAQGFHVFRKLRRTYRDCPIILLMESYDDVIAAKALTDGAQDCLAWDDMASGRLALAVRHAIERNRFIVRCNRQMEDLQEQAMRDPLTGLFNRRYLEYAANREISSARRSGSQFGIVMVDVDHLKSCNDRYGHDVGDRLIYETAHFLKTHVREYDITCRFGGDEFVLLMPGITAETAALRARKICADASKVELPVDGDANLTVTISLGVSAYPHHGRTVEGLLKTADYALYKAKENGRNRVVLFDELQGRTQFNPMQN